MDFLLFNNKESIPNMNYKIENKVVNYGTSKTKNYIVVAHETANDTSSIDSEVKYMKRNWKNAFVSHFVGGGGRIIQIAPVGRKQYGAGGKANGYAYAQVELCRTKDKATFEKDYAAYIWLLRHLADQAGMPKTLDAGSKVSDKGVKSHDWVRRNLGGTTHTDPYAYLSRWGISKSQFKKDVENGIGAKGQATSTSKPDSRPTSVSKAKVVGKGSGAWSLPDATVQHEAPQTKGDGVLAIQKALCELNFYPDKGAKDNGCDGYYGKDTADAVKRFQSVYVTNDVDGIYGKNTKAAMLKQLDKKKKNNVKDAVSKAKWSLPVGNYMVKSPQMHGSDVLAIQKALCELNFYPEVGAKDKGCDSYYGKNTANAVKRFQSIYVTNDVDGIYGKNTRAAMLKQLNG